MEELPNEDTTYVDTVIIKGIHYGEICKVKKTDVDHIRERLDNVSIRRQEILDRSNEYLSQLGGIIYVCKRGV